MQPRQGSATAAYFVVYPLLGWRGSPLAVGQPVYVCLYVGVASGIFFIALVQLMLVLPISTVFKAIFPYDFRASKIPSPTITARTGKPNKKFLTILTLLKS